MSAIYYDHARFRCPACQERVRVDGVAPFHQRLREGQRFQCPGCDAALTWARLPIRIFRVGEGLFALAFVALFVPGVAFAPVLMLGVASLLLATGMMVQHPVPILDEDGSGDDVTPRQAERATPHHPELDEDDLERILRRDYPEGDLPEIRRWIAPIELREKTRVIVACLKIAEGSTERLRGELRQATGQWREKLAQAEYPTVTRRWRALQKAPVSERQAAYDRDWEQYFEWLARSPNETGLDYERGSAGVQWGGRRIACGGPVNHAVACPETGLVAVLIEAGSRPEALELYTREGKPSGRWTAPAGFTFYTLQEAPSLTPGFTVVCIPTEGMEAGDWQFRIDLARDRLERYSPWR